MKIGGSPHRNSTGCCSSIYPNAYENNIFYDLELLVFSPTRVPRRVRVEADLPISLSISLSRDRLLLIVDSKYVNSSTTTNFDGKAIHQRLKV